MTLDALLMWKLCQGGSDISENKSKYDDYAAMIRDAWSLAVSASLPKWRQIRHSSSHVRAWRSLLFIIRASPICTMLKKYSDIIEVARAWRSSSSTASASNGRFQAISPLQIATTVKSRFHRTFTADSEPTFTDFSLTVRGGQKFTATCVSSWLMARLRAAIIVLSPRKATHFCRPIYVMAGDRIFHCSINRRPGLARNYPRLLA